MRAQVWSCIMATNSASDEPTDYIYIILHSYSYSYTYLIYTYTYTYT
jgi:hypothetical protein